MGKEAIKKGSGLANWYRGENISIRSDNWIPENTYFQPYSLVHVDPGIITKASQLINLNSRTWNSSLIHQNLNSMDAGCILSIPLALVSQDDCIAWFLAKDGIYSVNRGHWFLNYLASSEFSKNGQPSNTAS